MKKLFPLACVHLFLSGVLTNLSAQNVSIQFDIFDSLIPDTYFSLVGQSAYIQYQTGAFTTGGQLDNYSGPGSFSIEYTDIFPPVSISDYQSFSYFGLVETRSSLDNSLVDTSFILAYRDPVISPDFEVFFPGFFEDDVVNDLRNTFDSPAFFDILNYVINDPLARGAIELPDVGVLGENMVLLAFQSGSFGHSPNTIGSIRTSILIPEPTVTLLGALGSVVFLRRRRS